MNFIGNILYIGMILWDIIGFLALPVLFLVIGLINSFPWQYYAITIGGYFVLFIILEIILHFIFKALDKKYTPLLEKKLEKYLKKFSKKINVWVFFIFYIYTSKNSVPTFDGVLWFSIFSTFCVGCNFLIYLQAQM